MVNYHQLIKPEHQVFSSSMIQERITELADEISRDHQGQEILLIGALKSSIFFVADLIRKISIPVVLDFIDTEKYPDSNGSGIVKITKDLEENLNQKTVLLVRAIVDAGTSLEYLLNNFRLRNPKGLKVCALLQREEPAGSKIKLDYVGFRVNSSFLVGYGMDYQENFRNLASIYKIDKENI